MKGESSKGDGAEQEEQEQSSKGGIGQATGERRRSTGRAAVRGRCRHRGRCKEWMAALRPSLWRAETLITFARSSLR